MKPLSISTDLAKSLAVSAQLLDNETQISHGKDGILQIINQLGYIQIDTISIIRRSHHHTLWTRYNNYQEEMLDELQAKDRTIFEYWGHAMSYLPMSDYRYALHKMHKFRNSSSPWAKYQSAKCSHLLKPVLNRIRDEGPLGAKDFAPPPGRKGGTWWDWKPAKVALELLFWQGDLMISKRENFQKIYDLTERILPDHIDISLPSKEESGLFLVKRSLQALGIASEKDIRRFLQTESARDSDIQIASNKEISQTLKELTAAGEAIPVIVEDNKSLSYYMLPEATDKINRNKLADGKIFLLSPFDNLIIQRDRVKRIFGFDYALECYQPPAKRTFGYYVLPILWGHNFVGKLDPRADRNNRRMIINNLSLEKRAEDSDNFLNSLATELVKMARFNQCEQITVRKMSPAKLKPVLYRFIKQALLNFK
ncbi:MAG: crosslink repair DNA glycosylase YcaQ family protein [Calditrichota bacterium]|jgi:uncharacterized protein YcaQ